MKRISFGVRVFVFVVMLGAALAPGAAEVPRAPVILELFTSEGCSDCPPADTLVRELESAQPVPGVEVIALAYHVDYWDHQGWRDRFSSAAFTKRQYGYGERFRLASVYTPQVVVDGREEMVGSDRKRVWNALTQSAHSAKAQARLSRGAGNALEVEVSGAKGAEVFLAITESNLSSDVREGENRGRQLRHAGVVRWFKSLGATHDGTLRTSLQLPLASDWRRENLHAVVFAQHYGQGEITAAASVPLN